MREVYIVFRRDDSLVIMQDIKTNVETVLSRSGDFGSTKEAMDPKQIGK